jgi:magnesium transporter
MSDHRFSSVSSKGKITPVLSLAEALAVLHGTDYVWLDYFNPTVEEITALTEPFGLHPLTIEDCFDEEQVPKIDDFPTYTHLVFNSYRYADGELEIEELDCIIGKNFLVTVHRNAAGRRLIGAPIDASIQRDLPNVKKGPDLLLHVILDWVVDEKIKAIEALQEELNEAEEAVLNDPLAFKPELVMHLRQRLLSLRKSVVHEREVLVRVCRKDSPFITERAIYHFRDIHDHLTRFFELIEICREMVTGLMELYLSIINNRMSAYANQTNRAVRRLTLITTIFMPLTLLAGIGGMSEWSMMTGPENWKVSYPLFLAVMVIMGAGNYVVLRWLDRKSGDERERDVPGAALNTRKSRPPEARR